MAARVDASESDEVRSDMCLEEEEEKGKEAGWEK